MSLNLIYSLFLVEAIVLGCILILMPHYGSRLRADKVFILLGVLILNGFAIIGTFVAMCSLLDN